MRMLLILLSLGYWAVATAQVPPGDDPGTLPAKPTTESAESVVPEEAEAATPVDDAPGSPADAVEEDSAIKASAQEEFDPDEEISEDYPVPLPSDI
jgi:hypothetical protein